MLAMIDNWIDPDNPRETPDDVDTSHFEESVDSPRYEGPEEEAEE